MDKTSYSVVGAGSGKTYTLVQVIKKAIEENPSALIACMTYTNAAVKEIEERVNHKNLNVTTIHDFLWDNIKHFQKELKACLIALANDQMVKAIKVDDLEIVPDDFFDNLKDTSNLENKIQYKEFSRISKGIISHDEVIAVSDLIFERYPKLGDIVKDKYKFIFIDEYQDTQKEVVRIFLDHFKLTKKRNVIGFFGDTMQSIYDDGIGNLDEYKSEDSGKVREVQKKENRRNPSSIIDLANKIRTDDLEQIPSEDTNAPNMKNGNIKTGEIKFLYSNDRNIDTIKKYLGWNFENSKETKELNLTHNLIAGKANFRTLMDIYDKDPILSLKNDILKKIKDIQSKGKPEIPIDPQDTFDDVVDKFQLKNRQRELKKNLILNDPNIVILYNKLKDLPFSEVRKIYVNKDQLLDDKKKRRR